MSKKYKEYWGDDLGTGYSHFTLFGLLLAKVVRREKDGFWVTFEPSSYYTEEVHKLNKDRFAGFFDDEDVPEIKEKMKKVDSARPALPSPPMMEEKKRRGRPPKVKETTSEEVLSPSPSELEMPKLEL